MFKYTATGNLIITESLIEQFENNNLNENFKSTEDYLNEYLNNSDNDIINNKIIEAEENEEIKVKDNKKINARSLNINNLCFINEKVNDRICLNYDKIKDLIEINALIKK